MSEASLSQRIRTALHAQGWWIHKMHGNVFQSAGLPDLIAMRNRIPIGIETKVKKNKLTPLQEKNLKDFCEKAGAFCLVPTKMRSFEQCLPYMVGYRQIMIKFEDWPTMKCTTCGRVWMDGWTCLHCMVRYDFIIKIPSKAALNDQRSSNP